MCMNIMVIEPFFFQSDFTPSNINIHPLKSFISGAEGSSASFNYIRPIIN